jgi:lysophospholipase L1-like esterase
MISTLRNSLLVATLFAAAAPGAPPQHWVASWGTSPAPQSSTEEMRASHLTFANQTLREIVHLSLGGGTVRVRLSNAFGKQPLEIGAVHVALRFKESAIVAGSDRAVTFNGHRSVSIPPNAPVLSDPVKLDIPAASDLAISIFIPKSATGAGVHYFAQQKTYVGSGDLTAAPDIPAATTLPSWVFLTGVDVLAPQAAATVVAFGDSITDGAHSTPGANCRWPDFLAARLLARRGAKVAAVNAGIGGNRVLSDPAAAWPGVNSLARFDRDVLAVPGVKYVVLLEGINDLGSSTPESDTVTADDLIAAMKQLIARAHDRGLKIVGATLLPFEGTPHKGYFTPAKDLQRQALNDWIRTSHAFDAVIDFDRALRDPQHPSRMLPQYDSGDHLHPGDAGYRAMGEAVDLKLFE